MSHIFCVRANLIPQVDSPTESHGSVRVRQDVHRAVAAGGVLAELITKVMCSCK